MQNPKTTLAGLAALIVALAAHFGFHVSPETITLILTGFVTLIGILAKDGGAQSAQ